MRSRLNNSCGIAAGCALQLLLSVTPLRAQTLTPLAAGLGDASVAGQQVWGASTNPAMGLQDQQRFGVQVFATTPLDLAGLSRYGLDLALQPKGGVTCFQINAQYTNPPGITLSTLRFAASRALSPDFRLGLRIGAGQGNYAEYGNELIAIAEGGIRYQVNASLAAAADYSYGQRDLFPLIQRRLRVGIDYTSSKRLHILLAASQAPELPIALHIGLDYRPSEALSLALGYQSAGQTFAFAGRYQLASGLTLATGVTVFSRLPLHTHFGAGWVE